MCDDSLLELHRLQAMDLSDVKVEDLVDIRTVTINPHLSQPNRLLDFLNQIKNPYCYRHGDFVVQIGFSNTEVTLTDRLNEYLKNVVAAGI